MFDVLARLAQVNAQMAAMKELQRQQEHRIKAELWAADSQRQYEEQMTIYEAHTGQTKWGQAEDAEIIEPEPLALDKP